MSACAQCGTIANPTDKFCNTCGAPVNRQPAQGQPPPARYGNPAQQQPPQAQAYPPGPPPPGPPVFGGPPGAPPQGYGAPQPAPPAGARPARCQMGHDIPPGASYCPQGHPIALEAMQFANDQYGQPAQGYAPPGGGNAPPGYGAPQGYAPPMPGAPPPLYGQGYAPQPGFGGSPPGFGAPPPAQPPFGAQGGFQPAAAPPPQPGFGAPGAYAPPPAPPVPVAEVPPGAKLLRGFLISFQSNGAGEFWPLHAGRLTVGRANAGEPTDIPLADATISSRHAVLAVDPASGSITVEDTSSTNGTYVNEEHIGMNGRRELRDGDRVRFGGYTTIVKIIGRIA